MLLQQGSLTPEAITALIGVAMAVVFEYFPKLHQAYNNLPDNKQKVIMLVAVALVVYGAYGLSCANVLGYFQCTADGFWQTTVLYFITLSFNQGMHRLLPKNARGEG